jgi:hypothetical protein
VNSQQVFTMVARTDEQSSHNRLSCRNTGGQFDSGPVIAPQSGYRCDREL